MRVTILGSGTPMPDPERAGPSTLVEAGGHNFLVDCGRGVMMRLAAAGVPNPGLLHTVLLTHLHSDHTSDFNDIITTGWIGQFEPGSSLKVIGPEGTQRFVDRTLAMLEDDIGYRLAHHEDLNWEPAIDVTEVTDGVALEDDGVRIITAPTDHRPVAPTVGYRFEHDGSSAVAAGDGVPCEGLTRLCAGADVYVQTVINRAQVEAIPLPRLLDILDYHSCTVQAAETAAAGGVKKLVFTHQVPAPPPEDDQKWIDEVAHLFDGEIIMARDLTAVDA